MIRYDYSSDVLSIITGSSNRADNTYDLPEFNDSHKVKLSVYESGQYRESYELSSGSNYYVKDGSLILKPNDKLDDGGFFEGTYELQYDFLQRVESTEFYIDEVSPTRKEIRVREKEDANNQSFIDSAFSLLHNDDNQYTFEGYVELPNNQYIAINSFVEDRVSYFDPDGEPIPTLIFKLNEELPNEINRLYQSFKIVKKFIPTQTQEIFFADIEGLSVEAKALEIDYSGDDDSNVNEDALESYNTITGSLSEEIFDSFKRERKDLNLNIDYSEFKNHIHFGSAVSKLQNFKLKAQKLEGKYILLENTLTLSSSADIKSKRKNLFKEIRDLKDTFTPYENFLYNDGQSYSTSSAPGFGVNLAGSNFDNNHQYHRSLQDFDGFDKIQHFSSSNSTLHMFTDIYDVSEPPFYNTNDFVYLSFILSGNRKADTKNDIITENSSSNIIYSNGSIHGFTYNKNVKIPLHAASGSALLNPQSTGSEYRRYIVRAQQNFWRPKQSYSDVSTITDFSTLNSHYEILTGSNYISASTTGGIGDVMGYGIKDSSGQHTPYFFPNIVNEEGLIRNNVMVSASILPQGDLFPIRIKNTGNWETFVSDIRVSYKDPTNARPFSPIYKVPSGSDAGSDEFNNWYSGMLSSASLYDDNNIHSLTNNLPEFLRQNNQHKTLRDFVNMLGEEFDLLRNYIDNYLNLNKLGYKNPNSIPDNLLPIVAQSSGWKLISSVSSSLSDYIDSNKTEEIGTKNVTNATWKKVLNNLIYVYKTKGSVESIKALLNIYGFNSDSFNLREHGGSVQEHNPTIITNDAQNLLEGLEGTSGSISFIENITPFFMLNMTSASRGNRFGVDWFCNDATPNGIEMVFNANKPSLNITQSLMRLSGSSNDLWNINLIPEHNNATSTKGKIQFRLNRNSNGSATTHYSMETPFIEGFFDGNIYNIILQRNSASDFEDGFPLSQSYDMFVGRKNNDQINDFHAVSMSVTSSLPSITKAMAKNANRNFRNSGSILSEGDRSQNLLLAETVTGSIAEVRAWGSYLSMSKFKQHILNYESTVGGTITSSFSDVIYRYRLNEGYKDSDSNPNLASLKINDSNPNNVKDFSHLITTQDDLNFRSVTTEQNFYQFSVRGAGNIANDNMVNMYPELSSQANLNPNFESINQPNDGTPGRVFANNFGTNLSYVNAIDSLIFNMIPDFNLENHIGDYDSTLSDTYKDLLELRKNLIQNSQVTIDVASNLSSVENFVDSIDVNTFDSLTPANTQMDFSYDVMNDVLYRNKLKNAKIQTQLNPNEAIGSASLTEPTVVSSLNSNVKDSEIDVLDSQLTMTSTLNEKNKSANITVGTDELQITSTANQNFYSNNISLNTVDLSNSSNETILDFKPENFTNLLLGSKNEFFKNHGKSPDNTWFKSSNPGTGSTYNTYYYEDRFNFVTIGDTEVYIPITASFVDGVKQKTNKHDEFEDFFNRQFIDAGDGYSYSTLHQPNPTIDGRMVGRTSYFSSSEGNIYYPSNHFINARTSKDVLNNLIYKGTQHDGSNPTQDPTNLDPQHTSSAYVFSVSGEGKQLQIT